MYVCRFAVFRCFNENSRSARNGSTVRYEEKKTVWNNHANGVTGGGLECTAVDPDCGFDATLVNSAASHVQTQM